MVVESPDGGGAPVAAEAMVQERVALVSKQAVQIQTNAKSFAAAAGKGFHIDPEAAATLINACRGALTELQQTQTHLDTVSQTPKLGQTPGANVVAPFTQSAATDAEGIRPVIDNLMQTLRDMIQAYQTASTDYAQTEELVVQAMKSERTKLAPMSAPVLNT
jgi:hypothetical protein